MWAIAIEAITIYRLRVPRRTGIHRSVRKQTTRVHAQDRVIIRSTAALNDLSLGSQADFLAAHSGYRVVGRAHLEPVAAQQDASPLEWQTGVGCDEFMAAVASHIEPTARTTCWRTGMIDWHDSQAY